VPPRWVYLHASFSFRGCDALLEAEIAQAYNLNISRFPASRYAIYNTNHPICSSNPKIVLQYVSLLHHYLSSPTKNLAHTQSIKPHSDKRHTDPNDINDQQHKRSSHELRAEDPEKHQMPPQMSSPHRSRQAHHSIIRHVPTQRCNH